MAKTTVTLEDILEARERIKPYVVKTPLLNIDKLDEKLGCEVYLKAEMLQKTGAFNWKAYMESLPEKLGAEYGDWQEQ